MPSFKRKGSVGPKGEDKAMANRRDSKANSLENTDKCSQQLPATPLGQALISKNRRRSSVTASCLMNLDRAAQDRLREIERNKENSLPEHESMVERKRRFSVEVNTRKNSTSCPVDVGGRSGSISSSSGRRDSGGRRGSESRRGSSKSRLSGSSAFKVVVSDPESDTEVNDDVLQADDIADLSEVDVDPIRLIDSDGCRDSLNAGPYRDSLNAGPYRQSSTFQGKLSQVSQPPTMNRSTVNGPVHHTADRISIVNPRSHSHPPVTRTPNKYVNESFKGINREKFLNRQNSVLSVMSNMSMYATDPAMQEQKSSTSIRSRISQNRSSQHITFTKSYLQAHDSPSITGQKSSIAEKVDENQGTESKKKQSLKKKRQFSICPPFGLSTRSSRTTNDP